MVQASLPPNSAPPTRGHGWKSWRPRLVPLTIFAAALLLTVKIGALLTPGTPPSQAVYVSSSRAESQPAGKAAPTPLAPGTQKAENKPAGDAKPGAEAKPASAKPAAEKGEAAKGEGEEAPATSPRRAGQVDPINMSQSEIDILQALSERRKQLDERERTIEQREALMKVAEQRIAEKVAELKDMQSKVEAALKKQDGIAKKQESDREEQLKRLVKIYENMKPKEAARIFEQLDDGVLIDVAERMKEVKLAPVLASMEPKRATTVTTELAKRRDTAKPAGG